MTEMPNEKVTLPDTSEAGSLAFEMASEFRSMVEYYKTEYGLSTQEAVEKLEEPVGSNEVQRALGSPPSLVTWLTLARLCKQDAKQGAEFWERIKKAALDELRSGHRAARALEVNGSDCWERAQFCALRDDLVQSSQARTGIECQLMDQVAQAHAMVLFWTKKLSRMTSTWCEPRPERETWQTPAVSEAAAIEQAAGMVDRFNKMSLRTLRALRELRRAGPQVIVQNAGQVNVGQQQVNMANGSKRE